MLIFTLQKTVQYWNCRWFAQYAKTTHYANDPNGMRNIFINKSYMEPKLSVVLREKYQIFHVGYHRNRKGWVSEVFNIKMKNSVLMVSPLSGKILLMKYASGSGKTTRFSTSFLNLVFCVNLTFNGKLTHQIKNSWLKGQ